MGEFGWAYISGSRTVEAKGIDGSVQYKDGNDLSGSSKFTFNETDGLIVTGSVTISGSLTANEYRVNVVDQTVTNLYSSGSTKFGNTADDTHQFTGSVYFASSTTTLSASAGSTLIYRVTGSYWSQLNPAQQSAVSVIGDYFYLSSSNTTHRGILNTTVTSGSDSVLVSDEAVFLRADNPALVVSGAAVFNDPISIQGGIFGASPVNVYAPLLFRRDDLNDTDAPDEEMRIEGGKFVGNLVLSSSNDNHGLFIEGAGRLVMNSLQDISGSDDSDAEPAPEILMINNTPGQFSAPVLDMRNLNDVNVDEHQFFVTRRHSNSRFYAGESRYRIELPVLTGSNSSSADDYETVNYDIARTLVQTDPRRNSHLMFIQTLESNIDPEYELLDATNDADRNLSGSDVPIIHPNSPLYDSNEDNYSASLFTVFGAGSFANAGQGNRYGLKRGVFVFGNILPQAVNLNGSGLDKISYQSYEGTIGHPVTRWGDFYIHDNRHIRWGPQAGGGSYKTFYNSNTASAADRDEENTVILGYSTSSNMLEVSGSPMYLLNGLNVGGGEHINFGATTGSDGYGIRDNSGTLQFKNSGGTWEDFGTGTGDSTIGAAEDGDYTDGLFTDLTSSMPIGTPIDRFNEVLKILAPSPAPSLSRIDYTNTAGISAKLSFDSTDTITDYANSSTEAGFDTVTRNNIYESETSGSNERLGIYDGTQDIEGVLNFNVTASTTNGYDAYTADAFGNAETGSLKLELNGTVVHTVDLSSFGSGNSYLNTTGSGFTSISVTASSYDGNGAEWYIFKYRTAQYKVDTEDQRAGWNYARAVHSIGSTDYETNYVEWVNDPDGSVLALSATNARIEDVFLTGSKFVSGVEYNTDLTASYKAEINNIYRNVYPDGNIITFNETNCDPITAQSLSALGVGEDETKVAQVTASVNNDQNLLLNGSISVSLNATHPLKSNLSNSGLASITGMLIDNDTSDPNSNLSETFIDEDFRITSGSYDTQASASSATWDSTVHMTSSGLSGYNDGMIQFNRRLYNPVDGDLPASGDFSSLANVETGQPDYSSESGIRTYFRKIQNTSGGVIRDMKITSQKSGFKFSSDTIGLDPNDAHFYIKIPGSTGWMNISETFNYGFTDDGDGAYINGASDNSNATGTGNSVHCLTFGTQSVANNEYVLIKIETNGMWGYVSQLDFQLGASDVAAPTESLALDDIDADDTGTTVKLSFGASNTVSDYSNATGSSISLTDFDTNSIYNVSGDRRGVFSSTRIINGTLNEDVGSNGSNYTANSFKDAYTGSVVLEVNGTEVHTVSLANLNAITNDFNGNSSGFSLSSVSFSETTDGIPDYTKPYRTGTYQVGTADQNTGWNYARVIHRIGGTDTETNYVEWIIDPSGSANDTEVSVPVLDNFDHSDVYYQSGIGYFASNPSASFAFTGSNFYRNVYQNGTAITFPITTNCSVSNIRITGSGITTFDSAVSFTSMPALNNTTGCETTSIEVTGTMLYDGSSTSISGGLGLFTDRDVTVTGRILHPFKSDRTTNSASKTSFMIYSGSIGSTNLNTNEYFNTEDYRIVSGNYANQAAITSSANTWDSTISVNDTASNAPHADGLVTVNGYAISPFNIGVAGDTRNVSDGGSLQAPSSNPNYSTLDEDVRTIYRYFRNESGASSITPTITLYGDANLIAKSGAFYTGTLGANKNITVEMKVSYDPTYTGLDDKSTAWADCIRPYQSGVQPTTDGVGIFNGGGSDLNQTVTTGGRAIPLQLQQSQIRDDQYFVVKISAHKDWTGYLSRIQITY